MRPGYVRPGLTVDEAHRKWNMRLVRERKKRYNALKKEDLMVELCPWCMFEGEWIMSTVIINVKSVAKMSQNVVMVRRPNV